jgi:hypothetical protein
MSKEKVIELVKLFRNTNYKDLFGALIVFELLENEYFYNEELNSMDNKDIKYLENLYIKFMDSPTISGLLNEELKDMVYYD